MGSFKKAERRQAKLKLAITGPSGAGKTMGALLLAKGMANEIERVTGVRPRIGVADSENNSASLYADRFEFETVNIDPPYTVEKYIKAITDAQKEGLGILIVDSISHAWTELLSKKEQLDSRGGRGETNKFANWAPITKDHESFKAWINACDIHMICSMRSKQDYVLAESGKPQKVGMAPIQRDGMEYEFTTVFDVAMNHEVAISKDRTSLFDGKMFKISEDTGEKLMEWLFQAKPEEPKPQPEVKKPSPLAVTWKRLKDELKWDDERAKAFIFMVTGKKNSTELSPADLTKVNSKIDAELAEMPGDAAEEPTSATEAPDPGSFEAFAGGPVT